MSILSSDTKGEARINPAHRLGEGLGRILGDGIGIGKAAVPGRRAADLARRQPVNDEGRQQGRKCDEEEHQKAVIGTPALRDRHDGEPGDRLLRGHVGADQPAHDRRQRVDHRAGKDPGQQAEARQARPSTSKKSHRHRRRRPPPRCGGGRERRCRTARTKQAPASAAASASMAPTAGIINFSAQTGSDGLSRIA